MHMHIAATLADTFRIALGGINQIGRQTLKSGGRIEGGYIIVQLLSFSLHGIILSRFKRT